MNKIIINLNSLQPKDRALVTSLYPNVATSTCVGSVGDVPSDPVGAPLLVPTVHDSLSPAPLRVTSYPLSPLAPISPSLLPLSPASPPSFSLPPTSPQLSLSSLRSKRKSSAEVLDDSSSTSTEDETSDASGSGKKEVKIEEEEGDPSKFRFKYIQNGTKALMDKRKQYATRVHFRCKQRKETGCEASYTVTTSVTNNEKTIKFQSRVHNHYPPTESRKRCRLDKELKGRITDYLNMGINPAKVHQQLVNESPSHAPSVSQVKNLKYRESMKDMPSGDALYNIQEKHPGFVQKIAVSPDLVFVLISDFGLRKLKECRIFLVDGTFRTTECGLVLTIVLGIQDGVAIPCAYMLSNSRTETVYKKLYRTMKKKTNSMMSPQYLILDFEQALSDGFTDIFPSTIIIRDRFHFVQANNKRLIELGLQDLITELSSDLKVLWEKPSKEEFDAYIPTFLDKWDRKAPQYSRNYFRTNWLDRHPPHEWAAFGRCKEMLSGKIIVRVLVFFADEATGSAQAEGYNRRLSAILPCMPLAVDKMVDFLANEDAFWCNLVNTPALWSERKIQTAIAKAQHLKGRSTAASLLGNKDVRGRVAQPDDACNQLKDKDEDDVIVLVDQPTLLPKLSAASATDTPANNSTVADKLRGAERREVCKGCQKERLVNKQCGLRVCKKCCVASYQRCGITDHDRAKNTASKPYLETLANADEIGSENPTELSGNIDRVKTLIASAIDKKRSVYILYSAEETRGKPKRGQKQDTPALVDTFRLIDPQGFEESVRGRGTKVRAHCHLRNEVRHFFLHKIKRIEDYDWTGTWKSPQSQGTAPVFAPAMPLPTSVEEFLQQIKLECHWSIFKESGFDMLDTLQDLDTAVLTKMNVPLGHHGKLLRRIKDIMPHVGSQVCVPQR